MWIARDESGKLFKKETGYGGNTQFFVGYEHDIMH